MSKTILDSNISNDSNTECQMLNLASLLFTRGIEPDDNINNNSFKCTGKYTALFNDPSVTLYSLLDESNPAIFFSSSHDKTTFDLSNPQISLINELLQRYISGCKYDNHMVELFNDANITNKINHSIQTKTNCELLLLITESHNKCFGLCNYLYISITHKTIKKWRIFNHNKLEICVACSSSGGMTY